MKASFIFMCAMVLFSTVNAFAAIDAGASQRIGAPSAGFNINLYSHQKFL